MRRQSSALGEIIMANKTQINSSLNQTGKATVLNKDIIQNDGSSAENVTVLNPQFKLTAEFHSGMLVFDKYQIIEKLSVHTGEADLYLCTYQGKKYVAKVYRRQASIKQDVIEQLMHLSSPFIAKTYEAKTFNREMVKILPYYINGSLQGKKFTYTQLREHIIPCLNEGLKVLHDARIIHKDLKPSNIMITDNKQDVAIIDFGISSVTDSDNTVIVTRTGMTPEYSAPETFKGLFLSNSDYYSLGITLYELFCGKTPYVKMTAEEIEQYISIQRIPFPKDMPVELQELIKGLTYYDISNRRDKENPNRRWGYEEVQKWLAGIRQTIPGEGIDRKNVRSYTFLGQKYETRLDLVRVLVQNWDEGKKHLFRGMLSDYYRIYDSEAFRICEAAENEATRNSGKDDFIFWKTMYALNPKIKDFFWKGRLYAGLPAMGRDLLEHLKKNDTSMNDFMDSVFNQSIMSQYVKLKDPNNAAMLRAVEGLESAHRAYINMPRERRINLYLAAYMLSGQKILYIAGQEFHTLDEMTSYMKKILGENNEHLDRFKEFCHKLMDQYDNLTPALESWLIALGKEKAIKSWKESMNNTH